MFVCLGLVFGRGEFRGSVFFRSKSLSVCWIVFLFGGLAMA